VRDTLARAYVRGNAAWWIFSLTGDRKKRLSLKRNKKASMTILSLSNTNAVHIIPNGFGLRGYDLGSEINLDNLSYSGIYYPGLANKSMFTK
jgi:hypothetical protein